MTVVLKTPLIRTMVVPIRGVISKTVMRIASSIGIGYWHDGSMRFFNRLTYAFNYYFPLNKLCVWLLKYIRKTCFVNDGKAEGRKLI